MDKLTFYFDRNIGKRLPSALSKLRSPMDIRWHQGEGYKDDLPDDAWLEIVGGKNWIVITQDYKFHVIDAEVEAIRQHSVKCFYLPGASSGMWETLCLFTALHKKMISLCHENPTPFIFSFAKTGKPKRVL